MADTVALARRDSVELIRTGTWPISTGTWTATRDDLAAAVAARSCPAIRRPYLKLGHTDGRFAAATGDADPALGWFENLRLADGGHTLLADLVGVPAWLDSVMATAYPDRSVEGVYNFRCQLGHTHPFVLTGVAALGVTPPGVGTLRTLSDLRDVFDVAAAGDAGGESVPIEALIPSAAVAAATDENQLKRYWTKTPEGLAKWRDKPHPWTALYHHLRSGKGLTDEQAQRIASEWFHDVLGYWPGSKQHRGVKAATDGDNMPNPDPSLTERIHAAWNASNPPQQQWIVEAAPDEVIVMDNTDRSLTRIPVTVDGDRIAFGEPQRVRSAYVPDTEPVAAARMVFASQAESRPEPLVPANPEPEVPDGEPTDPDPAEVTPTEPAVEPTPEPPAAEPEPAPSTDPKGEDPVSTLSTDVRSRLGLPEDADDTAVMAALDALNNKAETAPTPEQVAASAEERDSLDKQVKILASQVQTISAELAAKKAEQNATVKASVLDDAQRLGKFAPADREQWAKDYDEAPGPITRVLASISPGTAVPIAAAGHAADGEPAPVDEADKYAADWASQLGISAEELTRG